jgi:pSer/pThr/pTyr-binding forkhead associated (FHA) protein
VSRKHCVFRRLAAPEEGPDAHYWLVEDLGSSGGTFLNYVAVPSNRPIREVEFTTP